jgi:hypothetical protein
MIMNKKLLLIVFSSFCIFTACKQEKKVPVRESEAEIEFEVTQHDFGKFPNNETREFDFVFHNVGATPLVIQNVVPTCGCIKERHPEKPIMPGCSGVITAIYDEPYASPSHFHKAIGIHSNAKTAYVQLIVDGETTSDDVENNKSETEEISGTFSSIPDSLIIGDWSFDDKVNFRLNHDGTISMKSNSDITYLRWERISANVLLIARQGKYGGVVTDSAVINTLASPLTFKLSRIDGVFTKQ